MVKKIIKSALRIERVRFWLFLLLAPFSVLAIYTSGIFDRKWYVSQYPAKSLPLLFKWGATCHYVVFGRRRGYTPTPFFIPEFYAPTRWKVSIIDPFAQYLLSKSAWEMPTSILYNGALKPINRIRTPLIKYIKNLNRDTRVHYDMSLGGEYRCMKWGETLPHIQKHIKRRTEQEVIRNKSRPVKSFDFKQEHKTINAFKGRVLDTSNTNEDKPLVSIIMPTWNRESVITEAIQSIQDQTLENWELLVIDDGSTDNTQGVVSEFTKSDKRIKLIKQNHGGVCKARNTGIKKAKGDWISFLDSDNTWKPYFLQTIIGSSLDQNAKAAYSAIKMDNNGEVRYRSTPPTPELLSIGNYIDLNSLVLKKELMKKVGLFDEKLKRMVDYDLVCRVNEVTNFIYVPIIGVDYVDHSELERITTTEPVSWDGVVKSKNFIDWTNSLEGRKKNLTSIIVPIKDDIRTAIRCLRSLLASLSHDFQTEIILLDSSSTSAMNTTLSTISLLDSRIRYYREPASHDNTLGSNYGFSKSRGEYVVFLNQNTAVEPRWLEEIIHIIEANNNSIVGPVQLKHNRSILSAGVNFAGKKNDVLPVNFLEDHPLSDLKMLEDAFNTQVLMGGCIALKASDFKKAKGFNPLFSQGFETHDLCLRLRDDNVQPLISKNSQITNFEESSGWHSSSHNIFIEKWSGKVKRLDMSMWNKAGFLVTGYESVHTGATVYPLLKKKEHEGRNIRRWAIKIAAPPDERRWHWGDKYFAESLAKSLEELKQHVSIDYLHAHDRKSSYLDDVVVNIRGLENADIFPGKINLMWVISHPDDVSIKELKKYDKVYAAGGAWAKETSRKADMEIEFLPQCTDDKIFRPTTTDEEYKDKALFVGNSRGLMRGIVKDAIDAGIDLNIYGGGWEGLVASKYIKGTFISNDKLATAYGSAKVVLNDHWDDMRINGFISNRIFDVLASGGYVITDNVIGLPDRVKERVFTYSNVNELKSIFYKIEDLERTQEEDREFAEKIHELDSFKNRAEQMLKFVLDREEQTP